MIENDSIEEIHAEIDACTRCAGLVRNFEKPLRMRRGVSGAVAIIGQGPGRTELKTSGAFAGPSGKVLDQWLIESGAPADAPRRDIYLTSVIKCCGESRDFETMAHHCRRFLHKQLRIVRPKLIITLGKHAYEHLSVHDTPYEEALCKVYSTEFLALITPIGFQYYHLPWPHPSGLNRWHNNPLNRNRLHESFAALSTLLKQE